MPDFFRPEVVLQRQRGAAGGVLLARPVPLTAFMGVVMAAVVGVAAWLSTNDYTHKVRLDGYLQAGPDGRLRAELFAAAPAVRSLRVDQSLNVRYSSLPVRPKSTAGEIVAISRLPVAAAELLRLPAYTAARARQEPLYRVTARLDAPPVPPSAAPVAIDADVRIERRRLIEWLVERRAPV